MRNTACTEYMMSAARHPIDVWEILYAACTEYIMLAAKHPIDVWEILYAACTEYIMLAARHPMMYEKYCMLCVQNT